MLTSHPEGAAALATLAVASAVSIITSPMVFIFLGPKTYPTTIVSLDDETGGGAVGNISTA